MEGVFSFDATSITFRKHALAKYKLNFHQKQINEFSVKAKY